MSIRRRKQLLNGYALIAPLFLFLLLTLFAPLSMVLWRSVSDPELTNALPKTAEVLRDWSGEGLPGTDVATALSDDLRQVDSRALASLSRRMSYESPAFRALLTKTRRAVEAAGGSVIDLPAVDPQWGDNATWQIMKRAASPVGTYHLLAALDLKRDYVKGFVERPEGSLYKNILFRTFSIAAITAVATLLLAFPLCSFLDRQSHRTRGLLLLFVLLPFWTSILVRTTAWVALLQDRGVINQLLMDVGLIDQPMKLLYDRIGVVAALVHVMLPFMVLPLLSSMRAADPRLVRAALSLGAKPVYAFWRVYVPQVLPGVLAGTLMVFVVVLGFYITPMLVGGPTDQMISYYIALFTTGTLNWGLASALGLILLVITLSLYALQNLLLKRSGIEER